MEINPLAEGDINNAIEVIRASFFQSVAPTWSQEGIDIFLTRDISVEKLSSCVVKGNICLKAIEDGELVGVLIFSSASKVAHLFVAPYFYGRGIARLLFESALNRLNDSVDNILLTSTEYAVPVYEKLGFNVSSPSFKYNGCIFQPMIHRVER